MNIPFSDFQGLSDWLSGLGLFHMDLTLERMESWLAAGPKPRFGVLHVVGTNGKGSTATFAASGLRAHGLRVGLYTSPHFVSFRERILLDGEPLPEGHWTDMARRVLKRAPGLGLTYFEFLTALAVEAFAQERVDVAVMEAGLGGRYDAVTAVKGAVGQTSAVTLFTPFGLDHQAVLGVGLPAIAADKACALGPGEVAITGPQEREAMAALAVRADGVGGRLLALAPPAGLPEGAELGLPGRHQRGNAMLALAGSREILARLGRPVSMPAVLKGLGSAFIPGRMQAIPGRPRLILDGAHNAHALSALKESLDAAGESTAALVFACLADKDVDAMLPLVRSLTRGPILVPGIPGCQRSMDPSILARRIGPRAEAAFDLAQALERIAGGAEPVLICGSLYLLAEFYKKNPVFLQPGRNPG